MEYTEWDLVTAHSWEHQLPYILKDISECTFVALDCEFSGIPTHQAIASRRQTLQERYAESKAAAEKYQILQVGLTIAKEDPVAGKYTLKPYNIHLSPLIDPALGIDRTFSFSSAAVQFLLKVGFDLQAPFQDGVQYLSAKEEKQAIEEVQRYNSRSRTVSIAQLELPKEESESVAFLATVRRDIDRWLERDQGIQGYLNVPSRQAVSSDGRPSVTTLNRFQKRLVHQLVETEYPTLTSFGRADFVKIVKYDEEREDNIRQQRMRRLENRLLEHRGFRWIIEALTGGDLSQLDPKIFENMIQGGENPANERQVLEDIAANIKSRLSRKGGRPALVGHNLFMDLIYLEQCFYGNSPDRVEDFVNLLHKKFPMLVDTKYIFTHDCGDMNPVASLEVIAEAHKNISKPEILIDPKHTRYQGKGQPHEAGYDSLLTARNFIKQAIQLPGARSRSSSLPATTGAALSNAISAGDSRNPGLPTKHSGSKVAHKNAFATVPDEPDLAKEIQALNVTNADAELIPPFSSATWRVYGNKLRVFGTYERVCTLNDV